MPAGLELNFRQRQKPMTIPSDSARFSRALQSAILWLVSVIILTALLLVFFIFEMFQVVKLSNHSYQVLAQTRTCEDLIVSTQNDAQGYLLTGDAAFVKSYDAKHDQSEEAFVRLKTLVQDNPEQTIRAEDLRQAMHTWFEHAKTIISHRAQNIPVNGDWVMMGKSIVDGLRAKLDKFADVEVSLRDNRLQQIRQMKRALAYGGGALVILLSLTVTHLVRKQMMVLDASYRTALDTIEQRHAALARSEADLEEQKEWLRVTLTSIGDGVIVTDPSGRVLLMNHESERLTGWNNVEALHQPLSSVLRIVDEKTRLAAEDPAARVFREKKVLGLANRSLLLSRTGEEWLIEDSAAPICDAKGKILGAVMVFHETTDKRHEQK
jgi:PAS domain S-box-containing protein